MGMAVRALGLVVGMFMVGAVIEPHVIPISSSVAQGIHGDSPRATPPDYAFQVAAPAGSGGASVLASTDEATPTPTPPFPLPTELGPRCPDPIEPVLPVAVGSGSVPIPMYQPVPYSTGEFVAVSHTNEHGANLRVAPRALARILRVVPEGEVLETVGGAFKTDSVVWGYVRDEHGTVGWIVSHMLTEVARVPGRAPLPFQDQGALACATFTPTPPPQPPIVIQPGATSASAPGAPGSGSNGGRSGGGLTQ